MKKITIRKTFMVITLLCLNLKSQYAGALEILALGDSITQGYQRNSAGFVYANPFPLNGAANAGGYLPGLRNLLNSNIERSNIYNWGIGGERSDGGVTRINGVINTRPNAEYILIMYGANDLYAGLSSAATQANLNAMIDASRARNVEPIVSEITPNLRFGSAIPGNYNVRIRNLATSKNVFLAKNYQRIAGGWLSVPYHSGDLLHLSNAGYAVMANEWYLSVKQSYDRDKTNMAPIMMLLLDD